MDKETQMEILDLVVYISHSTTWEKYNTILTIDQKYGSQGFLTLVWQSVEKKENYDS